MLIIGGTGKIGRELVKHYSTKEKVTFTFFKNKKLADELSQKYSSKAIFLDLQNINEDFFQNAGKHEKVIFSAGVFKRAENWSHETVHDIMDTNLKGPVILSEKLVKNGLRNLVFVIDISGAVPYPSYALNSISSAGLFMLIKVLARRYAPEVLVNGIAINALVPPSKSYVEKLPMKRLPTIDEVISILDFLLYENTYMTGQILVFDGGRSLL